jgi:hypothetical protein
MEDDMNRIAICLVLAASLASTHPGIAQKRNVTQDVCADNGESFKGASPVTREVADEIFRFSKTVGVQPLRTVTNPIEQFVSQPIDLRRDEKDDLLVKGQDAMTGADNDWFWIVLHASKHPKVVLWTGGNCVAISRHRTQGYPDILGNWSSAAGYTITSEYQFDADKYVLYKKAESHLKH